MDLLLELVPRLLHMVKGSAGLKRPPLRRTLFFTPKQTSAENSSLGWTAAVLSDGHGRGRFEAQHPSEVPLPDPLVASCENSQNTRTCWTVVHRPRSLPRSIIPDLSNLTLVVIPPDLVECFSESCGTKHLLPLPESLLPFLPETITPDHVGIKVLGAFGMFSHHQCVMRFPEALLNPASLF